MMLIALKGGLSLLFVIALHSFFVQESTERCSGRPQMENLQKTLGQPVDCPSHVKEGKCFRKDSSWIVIQLESSGRIESVFISDSCIGIQGVRALVDSLVPKSCRGKVLPKPTIPKRGTVIFGTTSCEKGYSEEYECLTIDYSEELCQNCAPASVNVIWNRSRVRD